MKELTFTIKIESWENISDDQAEEVVKSVTKNIASAVNRQIDDSDEGLFGNENEHCTRSFTVSSNELNYEVHINKGS